MASKDDSGYITQLKQQKQLNDYMAMCC